MTGMMVDQVKREAAELSVEEQGELTAYLVQLRNQRDPEYLPELQPNGDTWTGLTGSTG
jgi:hypothetical protein